MTWLLDLMARIAIRAPAVTLGVLTAVTLALGAAAADLEVDTGVEGFAPDDGVAATLDAIEARFGTTASVQLLLDAGPGGSVLDRDGLAGAERLEAALLADPTVAAALAADRPGQPAVVTWGLPFLTALETLDEPLADVDDVTLELVVDGVLREARDDVAPLLAEDLEVEPARARSGLVVVSLDATLPSEVRADASRAVEAVTAASELDGLRVSVLSLAAIEDGIERALIRDLPVLLGTSLLLVLLVLAWLFRSVADVIVGFAGLTASIIWMVGLAALLGPNGAGLLGPFNQIAIAVPVLLVGLGIDYSVHLTTRYREQRRLGDSADRAARVAMGTVGLALVLATVASVAGFLANLATPLPPIRDFGIMAALGIIAAFLILGGAVPATRALIDRRRDARAGRPVDAVTADASAGADTDPRWVRATSTLATRHIAPALGVTAVVLVVAAVAATGLSTEFDERDFLPENDPVLLTLDRLDAQFGGDVGERTYVLIDGPVTDAERGPALLRAVAAYEDALADVADVRTSGDRAEVVSARRLVDQLAERGVLVRESLLDELEGWLDPVATAADADLPEPAELAAVADVDDDELPDDLRDELTARLADGRSATGAVLATSDPDELATSIREALADDLAADRPDGIDDATLAALIDQGRVDDPAGTPRGPSLAALAEAAPVLERLNLDDRDALELLEALEAAGWAGDATPDGDTLAAQLAVLARDEPAELARVLDDDGTLVIVRTQAGPDGAELLADDLRAAAVDAGIEAAGGEVTIVSDPLVQAEIISSLSAAQLLAIAISLTAAAVLLVTATLVASRSVVLGLIGIVPSVVALVVVLGTMRALGLAFNALTATVASIAVGIGVPYGIHLINRFREARNRGLHADAAIADSLRNTGAALVGSAVTTGLAFAVLLLSASTPIRQFGTVSSLMIGFALLACLLVQPALLVLWGRRRDRVDRRTVPPSEAGGAGGAGGGAGGGADGADGAGGGGSDAGGSGSDAGEPARSVAR